MAALLRATRSLTSVASQARYTAVRGFAANAPKGAEQDIIVTIFKEQQQKYRALMAAHDKLKVPIDGSDASLNAYIKSLDAIKTKLNIKPTKARIDDAVVAMMENNATVADVRTLLAKASALRAKMMVGDSNNTTADLMAVLDKIEASIGGPLLVADKKGMAMWSKELTALEKAAAFPDDATLTESVKVEEVTHMVKELKETAIEDMEIAKVRDGLTWVDAKLVV